ncbi:hypothetical protein D2E26_0983 [Bifidobacterium dolichotidis]|uniref:DUF4125 domain-containing protein n=1 Tax=Bifidobacterium dolichotidis TaxID=2306976 RepID=A0A430FQ12_9BIFI|nr:DUF4125 family protein [Bifidobacterium dolichotidis]RSX54929.1 hypothetical protein D2E26_0983 [Bifidobacterium dolichotidis]
MQRSEMQQAIVDAEWQMFQQTQGRDGRAECQNNYPQFILMRMSQFMTWPDNLLESYLVDLTRARAVGRNLITEKYARMMITTDPEIYDREIKQALSVLDKQRVTMQEQIISKQIQWAREFRAQYPHLGAAMRVLETREDSDAQTSFETYLRGELSTYSDKTLNLYNQLILTYVQNGKNLTQQTVRNTIELAGFKDLASAEAAQA